MGGNGDEEGERPKCPDLDLGHNVDRLGRIVDLGDHVVALQTEDDLYTEYIRWLCWRLDFAVAWSSLLTFLLDETHGVDRTHTISCVSTSPWSATHERVTHRFGSGPGLRPHEITL